MKLRGLVVLAIATATLAVYYQVRGHHFVNLDDFSFGSRADDLERRLLRSTTLRIAKWVSGAYELSLRIYNS